MKNILIDFLLNYGFKIRSLFNEGPAYFFYLFFWWLFPTKVLRNKAACSPYANIRKHLLRLSGISIGSKSEIGYGTLVLGIAKKPPAVIIGERVAIAPYVIFVTSSYPDNSQLSSHPEVKPMVRKLGPIILENDCWVGAGAVIFPDVTLGRACIVGAGAVVRNDVAPFSIVAGNPSKCLRTLDPMEL